MAKRLHRVFEMYDCREEAVRKLTRGKISDVADVVDSEFWDFGVLVAAHSAIITHVVFKNYLDSDDEVASEFRKDIGELASRISVDSKVLLDFSGLTHFSPACIDMLVRFNNQLKHKGSRLVLCSIETETRDSFFASRQSCSY